MLFKSSFFKHTFLIFYSWQVLLGSLTFRVHGPPRIEGGGGVRKGGEVGEGGG